MKIKSCFPPIKRLILALCMVSISSFAYGADGDGTMTVPTVDEHCPKDKAGCVWKYSWTWSTDADDTYAIDTTAGAWITGKIVGVRVKPSSVGTAYTVRLVDAEGHDVLQGLFLDTEASATVSADSNFRVPVDDSSSAHIWVYNEFLYPAVTLAGSSDGGDIEVYVQIP